MLYITMETRDKIANIAKEIRVQRSLFYRYVTDEVWYERSIEWPDIDDNLPHMRHMKKFCQMKRQWAHQKWKMAEAELLRLCDTYGIDYDVERI